MRNARRVLCAAIVATVLVTAAAIPLAAGAEEEYLKAIRTIRCDCGCHPQSVENCACGHAAEMRETIAAMIEAPDGTIKMTGDAVIAKYVAESGEQILISPSATGFNLLAWLGPLIGLVLGLGVSITLIRYLVQRGAAHDPLPATPAPGPAPTADPGDDAYHEKLRRQLEEWD